MKLNILAGITIGDGNINRGHIRFGHSVKQKDYFLWKVSLLEKLFKQKLKYKEYTATLRDKEYKTLTFFSPVHKQIKKLRELAYPNGKKELSNKLLNLLTVKGLAIWFMDDGGCYSCIGEVQIATCCSYEEVKTCQKYFSKKWDINWRIKKLWGTDKYMLAKGWRSDDMIRFKKLIQKYIIPSMRYKIKGIMLPLADNKKALNCKSCGIDFSKANHKGGYCNPCRYEKWPNKVRCNDLTRNTAKAVKIKSKLYSDV